VARWDANSPMTHHMRNRNSTKPRSYIYRQQGIYSLLKGSVAFIHNIPTHLGPSNLANLGNVVYFFEVNFARNLRLDHFQVLLSTLKNSVLSSFSSVVLGYVLIPHLSDTMYV